MSRVCVAFAALLAACLGSLLATCLAASTDLPKDWKKCKKNDARTDKCLEEAMEHALKKLIPGNKKLGVLPIEPLHFDKLQIYQGDGPVTIQLTFTDTDLSGLSSLDILDVKSDWDHYKLNVKMKALNYVIQTGKYEVNGRVLVLPITGTGTYNLTFTGLTGNVELTGREVTKSGEKYMLVDTMNVDMDADYLYVHLTNLFNGNKALGDNMNLFLNENWKGILNELRPAVSRAYGEAFKQIANRIFEKIPIKNFFAS